MARIISSRKKYVPVKDLVVYPSKLGLALITSGI